MATMGIASDIPPDTCGCTPGCGARSTVLARGTTTDDVKLYTKGDTDFVFAEITLQPGGSTGWHHHPGPLLVAVRTGTLTRYDHNCRRHVHQAGDSFVEPAGEHMVHLGVNQGDQPAVLLVTYVVPAGRPLHAETSAPPCAADRGLPQ